MINGNSYTAYTVNELFKNSDFEKLINENSKLRLPEAALAGVYVVRTATRRE